MREIAMVVGCCLFVAACGSTKTTDLHQQHAAAQARLASLQAPQQKATGLTFADDYYIPPLTQAEAQLPAWAAQPVSVAAQGLAAGVLLSRLLEQHQVALHFAHDDLAQQAVFLKFDGTLAALLKRLANRFRWHLEWQAEQILIHEFEVAEFDVAFIAGDTSYFMGNKEQQQQGAASRGNSAPANAVNSRSEQFLNFSSDDLSVWKDLERALSLLLSERGQVTINQSSSSVLVRDYPNHVAQVRHYLTQQNERLTRQVAIDVQILEVTFNDDQQFAIDWDAIVKTAGGEGVLGFTSAPLSGLAGGRLVWEQQQGRAQGSQLLIDALEQQGLVQTSNHPRVVSLNNQIAKIVLEDNATYLAAAGSAATANVGRADILQPGVVTTGFELYLLPSIQNQEVILQLSTELSDLERIDEVVSGSQMIQTPHTNRKKFFMKALVENGQTLLMSGLKNERKHTQQQQSWLSLMLGGRSLQQTRRSETLVLLTPHIIERAQP